LRFHNCVFWRHRVPASLTTTDRSTRKPRLPILSPAAPVRHEERETPAALEPQTTRGIPRLQFVRIRTLVKYGMTVARLPRSTGLPLSGCTSSRIFCSRKSSGSRAHALHTLDGARDLVIALAKAQMILDLVVHVIEGRLDAADITA
jgi:hypothetical protein